MTAGPAREEIERLSEKLDRLAASLDRRVAEGKQEHDRRSSEKNSVGKEEAKAFRSACQKYRGVLGDNVPDSILKWMNKEGMFMNRTAVAVRETAVFSEDTPASTEWDMAVPTLFTAECVHATALTFRKTYSAMGPDRMNAVARAAVRELDESLSEVGKGLWFTPAKGPPHDNYMDEAWVPDRLRESLDARPAGVMDFGAPWWMVDRMRAWRASIVDLPLSGLSQVWHQRQGGRLVMLWPLQALADRGAHAAMTWQYLFTECGARTFEHFGDRHVSIAVLKPGDALWVPMGYQTACLAEYDEAAVVDGVETAVCTLVQPFLSRKLALAVPASGKTAVMVDVCRFLAGDVEDCRREEVEAAQGSADAGARPGVYTQIAPGLTRWLQEVETAVNADRRRVGKCAVVPVVADTVDANARVARTLVRTNSVVSMTEEAEIAARAPRRSETAIEDAVRRPEETLETLLGDMVHGATAEMTEVMVVVCWLWWPWSCVVRVCGVGDWLGLCCVCGSVLGWIEDAVMVSCGGEGSDVRSQRLWILLPQRPPSR